MFKELDFIERKEGYINLDAYFLEKYDTLNLNKLEKFNVIEHKDNKYWIIINSNKYMFKETNIEESIKELLASQMLDYVGYEHASYDLAFINGMYGVITRNFKKENCNYYIGDDLIFDYCKYINSSEDLENLNYTKYNNLSDIWDMLEIKYMYYPNKNIIIKNIMYKLTEKFAFDILINQTDGDSINWMIEENEYYATLSPIYDNQKMLEAVNLEETKNKNIKVEETCENRENYNNLKELKKYLQYSSDYFKEEFKMLMKSLTPNNIKWLFLSIENEIGVKLNSKIKNNIILQYNHNYNALQKVLNEELNLKR